MIVLNQDFVESCQMPLGIGGDEYLGFLVCFELMEGEA